MIRTPEERVLALIFNESRLSRVFNRVAQALFWGEPDDGTWRSRVGCKFDGWHVALAIQAHDRHKGRKKRKAAKAWQAEGPVPPDTKAIDPDERFIDPGGPRHG